MPEAWLPAFYYLSFPPFILVLNDVCLLVCVFSYGSGDLQQLKDKKSLGMEDFELRAINIVIFVWE